MTTNKFKLASALVLALGVIGASAQAADLKLKSKPGSRTIVKPGASTVLKGNIPTLPDLVVEPITNSTIGMPNTGVCGSWSSGYVNVKFRVRNQGNTAAEISDLNVTLQKQGQYVGGGVLQVPALAPGQTTTISLPVPAGAQPGYSQSIKVSGRVDISNYIPELIENNNWHTGYCHGPTT